jgi:hypothetical protein
MGEMAETPHEGQVWKSFFKFQGTSSQLILYLIGCSRVLCCPTLYLKISLSF